MRASLPMVAAIVAATIFLPACGQRTAAPDASAAPSLGRTIYDQQCAICHGRAGKGDTMIAASYPYGDLTDGTWGHGGTREELVRSTTDGIPKTPMRGFKGALSESEIEAVVDYVMSLSGS